MKTGNSMSSWGAREDFSKFYIFAGSNECNLNYSEIVIILKTIAQAVFYKYPDREERRLYIGDANSLKGCTGHPVGAHGPSLNTIDLNYYTFGKNNSTHYRAGSKNDLENKPTNIWKSEFGGLILLEDVFDWERNYYLWSLIKQAFPESKIYISDAIYDYMKQKILTKYGQVEALNFFKMTSIDTARNYNHHIHAHVYFGSKVNWELNTSKW